MMNNSIQVREDYVAFAHCCPHGVEVDVCAEPLCRMLCAAAENSELKAADKYQRLSREAAGLGKGGGLTGGGGHMAARMAGVNLDVYHFAQAALHAVYNAVLARAPAAPLPPPGLDASPAGEPNEAHELRERTRARRLVNPIDPQEQQERIRARHEQRLKGRVTGMQIPGGVSCRPLHAHLNQRAHQLGVVQQLSRGFVMLAGASRCRAFHELERNSTGPALSLPPLVLLCGPPGSGRTRLLARFITHSARCRCSLRPILLSSHKLLPASVDLSPTS